MKEQLITLETAKLAKEKGFDLPIQRANYHTELAFYDDETLFYSHGDCEEFPIAPTQSMLQMWLWKTHKIWVEITLWGYGIEFACVVKQAKGKEDDNSTIVRQITLVDTGLACGDPCYALEKGLFEALKRIEI